MEDAKIATLLTQQIGRVSEQQERTVRLIDAVATRLTKIETELELRVPEAARDHDEFRKAIADLSKMVMDHEGLLKWGRWGIAASIAAGVGFLTIIPLLWRIGSELAHRAP